MRRFHLPLILAIALLAVPIRDASAQPSFVNGLVIPGSTLDATRQPGANSGHLGFSPANLIPKVNGVVNYDAVRDDGANAGRQDNRGYEGLAITPNGKRLVAVLQDPLVNEPTPNNGRNGRNLRIVVFDNDHRSATRYTSIAQYAYQLELQEIVRARIIGKGGNATPTDPRQGRNIGLSAITAINDHEFLVLER